MKVPNEAELIEMEWRSRARSSIRREWLSCEGDALVEIHGWVLGVMCALERKRAEQGEYGVYRDTDRLIAELRQSTGPPPL